MLGLGAFTYFYSSYSKLIDEKLRAGPIANTAKIFAAPRIHLVGDAMTPADVADELRRSGYTESRGNQVGYYQIHPYFHRDLSRPGFLFRPGGRGHQVRRRQDRRR